MNFEGKNSLFRSFSRNSSDEEEAYQYHALQNIIGNNKDMLSLVEQFFNNNHKTLDICNSIGQYCLTNQPSITQVSEIDNIGDIVTNNYQILEESSKLLQSLINEQYGLVLKNLTLGEKKFQKKLKWNKKLKKVSNFIFVSGFVSVLTFSIIATAIAAPPFVTALASGLLVPIGSVQRWSTQLYNRRKKANKKKIETLISMKIETSKSKVKLVEILKVVNDMKDEIGHIQFLTQEKKKSETTWD